MIWYVVVLCAKKKIFAPSLRATKPISLKIDQDGVIYHENKLIPGAKELVAWLHKEDKRFLFLTNSSDKTPKDLSYKLSSFGIHVQPLPSSLPLLCVMFDSPLLVLRYL